MRECLDYDDGTRHTCEACAGDLEMLRDALTRSESARREAEENREMADGCLEEVREALVVMGMAEETTLKVAPMFYREAILHLFASERAARESWEREFNVANAERIRLHNEAENLAERLGQFEAAGCPNVATVLDRVETERAAREKAELERDVLRAANREAESQFVAELEAKRAAESRLSRAVEALQEEAEWLTDMAERTQHLVMPSSCRERAASIRAVLAEVDRG